MSTVGIQCRDVSDTHDLRFHAHLDPFCPTIHILPHRLPAYKSMVQNSNKNKSVFVSSQKALSFLRWYHDSTFGVFPHLTAIIDVKDGVSVITIVWNIGLPCLNTSKVSAVYFLYRRKSRVFLGTTAVCFVQRIAAWKTLTHLMVNKYL